MQLTGAANGLRTFLQDFTNKLNKMTEDESDRNVFTKGMQDTYQITVDPSFADVPLKVSADQVKNSKSVALNDYEVDPDSTFLRQREQESSAYNFNVAGEININTAIIKVLEEAMTSLQPVQEVWKDWFQKTTGNLRAKNSKDILSNVDIAGLSNDDFTVKWFRIKASLETDILRFDRITKAHPKTIKYHIEPYDLHIFRLVRPGLSLGGQSQVKVKKLYDYIFTGNNTDIMDLDINYKVAWYVTKLSPVNPHNKDRIGFEEDVAFLSQTGAEDQIEELLPTQTAPGSVRSTRSGLFATELKQDVESGKRVLTEPEKALINSLIDEMNKSNNTSGVFDFNNYMSRYNPVLDTFIEMFGNDKINANIPPLNQTTSTESVPSVPTNSVKGGKRMRYTKRMHSSKYKQMKKTRRKRQSGRSTRCSKRSRYRS
jgi:hypothetical protein